MTDIDRLESNRRADGCSTKSRADLVGRAETAARAELRGDRENILGAIGVAAPAPLARVRNVPDRWSFIWALSHFQ
jgi:hypothetical protein